MTSSAPNPASFRLVRTPIDLRFRRAALFSREWITPHYVRVQLRGDDITGFTSLGSDDHLRIFLPEGPAETVEELRASPSREYTPLQWGEGWLDLEFVVHGDQGVAGRWAATAPLGDPIGIGGPRGSMVIEGTPDAWFLAGDETAVPAIRRFAEQMGEDAVGRIVVEVADPEHEITIDAPAGVPVEFVHRGDAAPTAALIARLDGIGAEDRPEGSVFGFIAAEQAVVKAGRALLLERWGLDSDGIVVKGYWKRETAEYHAPH
ncbi:siderophore-interacting protein [Microbacterium sp. LRZ72]|uniref:siderophore-interacting protein n=1 Tax=Microbacterium sp. LRZ72 TaxID=2942481 RepID=UPI0029BD6773|nr:siderophore-interacting protein [Microbacterium sp. LRZ72]MDX2376080.1 siderophore-interacting protein [Microbacterium sp. LRZ72]